MPPSGNNGAPSQQAVNAFGNITAEQEAALRATGLLRSPKTLRQRFAELTDNLGKRLVLREDVNGTIYYDNDLSSIEALEKETGGRGNHAIRTKSGTPSTSADGHSLAELLSGGKTNAYHVEDVEIEGLAGQLVGDANASTPRTSPSGAILLRGVCKGQSGTTAGRGAGAEGQKEYPATGRGSGNNNPAASDVKAIAHGLLPTNAQSDGGAVGIVLLSNTFRQVTGARRSGARCRFIRRLAGVRP